MKQLIALSSLIVTLGLGISAGMASSVQTNFSGTWVLDKEKTQDVPPQLESVSMVVTQDDRQLTVESKVSGDFSPGGGPGRAGGPPAGGPPSGSPGGPPGGGPAGRGGRGPGMLLPDATFNLNGTETTSEVGGRMPGTARHKAHWTDGGTVLELSTSRDLSFQDRDVTITTRDRWVLSADGTVLTVDRTSESPRGTRTFHLVFRKTDPKDN